MVYVCKISPSVSYADSSLVRGSHFLPPSDEGGGSQRLTEGENNDIAPRGSLIA